jgi:hypothetical protein
MMRSGAEGVTRETVVYCSGDKMLHYMACWYSTYFPWGLQNAMNIYIFEAGRTRLIEKWAVEV